MTSLAVDMAFQLFLDAIEPTAVDQRNAQARAARLADTVKAAFAPPGRLALVRTAQIGSVVKGTAIRPLSDVDLLAVFAETPRRIFVQQSNSQRFLYQVRDALATTSRVEVVGARGQAVRLFYRDGLEVDVAPVLPRRPEGFFLPAGDGSWVATHPEYHPHWLNVMDGQSNQRLRPMIKLVKAWNRAHARHFKSFQIEVMVADGSHAMCDSFPESLCSWFENPHLAAKDPVFGKPVVDHGATLSGLKSRTALAAAAAKARDAIEADRRGDTYKALRGWHAILGDPFTTVS